MAKYRGPCIDCGAFKDQQYIKKRCIACYQKYHRSDKFRPRKRYDGPCIHCGATKSNSGRFIRKMCDTCYGRFKTTGSPDQKERKRYDGPCIKCGATTPGYKKYFQEKMCGKCYRHYSHLRDNPPKPPRYCIDCDKQLGPKGKLKRCVKCHRKHRWHTDPEYKRRTTKINKRYNKTKRGIQKARAHVRRRRAKLAEVENTLTDEQWQTVLKKFKYRCVYCGSKKSLEMDHVIPISKGGTHTIDNVVPACRACNASKRDLPPPIPVQTLMI